MKFVFKAFLSVCNYLPTNKVTLYVILYVVESKRSMDLRNTIGSRVASKEL